MLLVVVGQINRVDVAVAEQGPQHGDRLTGAG